MKVGDHVRVVNVPHRIRYVDGATGIITGTTEYPDGPRWLVNFDEPYPEDKEKDRVIGKCIRSPMEPECLEVVG